MTEKTQVRRSRSEKQKKVLTRNTIGSPSNSDKIAMHDLLGDKLRAYYNEVASEHVPERFQQLLMELEAKSKLEND